MKEKTPITPVPLLDITSVPELVNALGGPTRLAGDLGLSISKVKMWPHRRSIPKGDWSRIIDHAKRLKFKGLDADWLLALHRKEDLRRDVSGEEEGACA